MQLCIYAKHECYDNYFWLAQTAQVDAAKDVIKKLTFPFDSESFENPGIPFSH